MNIQFSEDFKELKINSPLIISIYVVIYDNKAFEKISN